MYIDKQTQLWASAALTATAVSTNEYDLGAPAVSGGVQREVGTGEPLVIALNVEVAADHTTGDETYEFDIITATATGLVTGQLIIAKYVILYSALTAGAMFYFPVPPRNANASAQRYLGAKFVGGGTTPTITVSAWVTQQSMIDSQYYYPTLITVN